MATKSKPDRRPVCYGVINGREWHVDFTLVPKKHRQIAANSFPVEIAGHSPGDKDRYALIFHHLSQGFETRKLRRTDALDIGDAVLD